MDFIKQFQTLIDSTVYFHMFWNSVRLTLPVLAGQLAVSAAAAYAFTVMRFRGKEAVFFLYIMVMLLPMQVTLMPQFFVAQTLRLGSYAAIILPGIFHPFGTFLLRQQMRTIPYTYIEAAKMDGAGHVRIFFRIVLPLIKPGLASLAMLVFVDYWNLIDQAVVFIREEERQPLSLFLGEIHAENPGASFAGAWFYAVPVLIALYYGQRALREGVGYSCLENG